MNQNAVYIIPQSPILNPEKIKLFENFNIEDTIMLRSTLYLNLIENFSQRKTNTDFYFYLDEVDKYHLTEEFRTDDLSLFFTDLLMPEFFFDSLAGKEFSAHKNNLIINPDSMGITLSDIENSFNLLNVEDESLIINKSPDGYITCLGFNNYSPEIFKALTKSDFIFDDFLARIKTCSHFIQTKNLGIIVKNITHFKQLYFDLSQKKSIEYCSQKMHERFTHLFIEHKDSLK